MSEVQYADGRTGTVPLAWATITLGQAVREGFVQLQRGSDEAIVGLELVQISPPSGERLVGILSSDSSAEGWSLSRLASALAGGARSFSCGLALSLRA